MTKVFCKLSNSFVKKIDKKLFYSLEKYLIESGLGTDKDSFDIIKDRIKNPPKLSPEEFVFEVFYVILASGFKQKIAKEKFLLIKNFICKGSKVCPENLLKIFGNKNKINAICKIWENKEKYCKQFYSLSDTDDKICMLSTLPYIGEITKNHIARNLGINKVKYDVWIQRLGIALYGNDKDKENSLISKNVKNSCDKMFKDIALATNEPIGYIDVVLWKSCQIGILKFEK